MRSLLLVRHPRPLVEPGIPADRWGLGADGLRAAFSVVDHLPPYTTAVLSSTSAVAAQAARAMADSSGQDIEVLLDDRLDEVAGPVVLDVDDADDVAAVERYLSGGTVAGWEPASNAVARFSAALRAAQHREVRATAVVTHGVVLALWLSPRLGVSARQIWSRLAMPDLWWYDPASNGITRETMLKRRGLGAPSEFVG